MIRTVRTFRCSEPPVIHLWVAPDPEVPLERQAPDLKLTRIYMGAAPADDTGPDYACVVGEVYDGNPMQRDRQRIVLDETIGLDPADFTEEERDKFQVHPNAIRYPTLGNFRRGVVALKELYEPEVLLLPGQGMDWAAETYQREMAQNKFFRALILTDGLQAFDERWEHQAEAWFPVVRRRQPIGIRTVREDEQYDHRVAANLFSLDLLKTSPLHATRGGAGRRREEWDGSVWQPVDRAINLVLSEMQDRDLTYTLRQWTPGDGYTDKLKADRERAEADRERELELLDAALWQAGVRDAIPDPEDLELP